jgi:hypothetical protein
VHEATPGVSELKLRSLISRYLYAVAKYWYAIIAGIALGWVDLFERVFGTWWIFPVWVRLTTGVFGLIVAQFLAYRDLDVERARKIKEFETALQDLSESRRKERMPPEVYNVGGSPNPIRITGSQHSVQGPYVDVWGGITVVNPTHAHMKIAPHRLVIDGVGWEVNRIAFHLKSNDYERYDRISVMGNDKQDYNLHLVFAEDKVPKGKSGELWMTSSNRDDEPFAIPISFA